MRKNIREEVIIFNSGQLCQLDQLMLCSGTGRCHSRFKIMTKTKTTIFGWVAIYPDLIIWRTIIPAGWEQHWQMGTGRRRRWPHITLLSGAQKLVQVVISLGLVWFGLVWFGLVWFGWIGMVWFGFAAYHNNFWWSSANQLVNMVKASSEANLITYWGPPTLQWRCSWLQSVSPT